MTDRPFALTMGDPAGIGPDVTLLTWQSRQHQPVPPFFVLACPDMLAARARKLGLSVPIAVVNDPEAATATFARALPVLPVPLTAEVHPGKPDIAAGPAVQASIEQAVELVYEGRARAVVTNPISKAVLYASGFAFPGHTEFLAELASRRGPSIRPVMLLVSDVLKVVPITIHIPLVDVPEALTSELIVETLHVTADGMRRYFGLENPRLAVTGLNPHAGEDGALGDEEETIILPALEQARAEGMTVSGPHPADTLFHEAARANYDVALGMYHDQALIPVKTLAFDTGVNVTLGLPFIRTSPDHGTAFAIAGTGKASPNSLIEALRLADSMDHSANQAASSKSA